MIEFLTLKDSSFSKTIVVAAMAMLLCFVILTSFRPVHAQEQPNIGTLRIITHVINDNGGTNQASDFTNCIDSSREDSTSMSCSSGDEQGNSQNSFDAGPYKVTQDPNNPVIGYTVSYSTDCSGVINTGQTKICTITYNDIALSPSFSNSSPSPSPSQIASKNDSGSTSTVNNDGSGPAGQSPSDSTVVSDKVNPTLHDKTNELKNSILENLKETTSP
jgi:hypothetical protein